MIGINDLTAETINLCNEQKEEELEYLNDVQRNIETDKVLLIENEEDNICRILLKENGWITLYDTESLIESRSDAIWHINNKRIDLTK